MRDRISFLLELLVPTAMAVFGVFYYFDTLDLSRQAVFFPYTLMAVMAVLAVLVVARELVARLRRRAIAEPRPPAEPAREPDYSIMDVALQHRNPALIIIFAAGYLYLFSVLGYTVATIIFITWFLVVLQVPMFQSLLVGILFPITLYLIFGLAFGIRI